MSFLSFLSSHRLHSSSRPWIEPLNVRFDLALHDDPAPDEAPDHVSLATPADLIPATAEVRAPEPSVPPSWI